MAGQETYFQTTYFDQLRVETEPLLVKHSADVLQEVLHKNPQVAILSYTTYDPELSSFDLIEDQIIIPFGREYADTGCLKLLHRYFEQDNEMFALASKTQTKTGETMHIPMFDFVVRHDSTDPVGQIKKIVSTLSGAIIRTDNSYHFIGFNLIEQNEWEKFMRGMITAGEIYAYNIIDEKFFEKSLERGYAALRLFGSKFPGKTQEPIVVSVTR